MPSTASGGDNNSDYRDHIYRAPVGGESIHRSPSYLQHVMSAQWSAVDQQTDRKRDASEVDGADLNDSSAVRRRISRACDQCNQQRSKCDGRQPCAHCVENQLLCAYARAHKKRGRVPKKEQKNLNGMQSAVSHDNTSGDSGSEKPQGKSAVLVSNTTTQNALVPDDVQNCATYMAQTQSTYYNGYDASRGAMVNSSNHVTGINTSFAQPDQINFAVTDPTTFSSTNIDMSGYDFPLGDDYSVAFMGRAPMVESPDWLTLTSATPMFSNEQWTTMPRPPDTLRFPVLLPILPYIDSIIPQTLACDLLEQYFAVVSLTTSQPKNPYVLSYIFRKQSILHPVNPRPCTTALLASMLWISAQHSDASLLTSQPDSRSRTCQKLLELTITMLKPLVHSHGASSSNPSDQGNMTQIDAGLGGLVLPVDVMAGNEVSRKQVDNLVTYIHLATVVSASERKAASLRWWNTAWSLAREIRLGRELPAIDKGSDGEQHIQTAALNVGQRQTHHRADSLTSNSTQTDSKSLSQVTTEEDREERRRTWWLLYAMDRHLALCYNRPTFFLNKECEGLLLPMDDTMFQLGQFDRGVIEERRRGLDIECTSLSIYGFFLPLMVILGEILDLNHTRNRPRFGPGAKRPRDYSETIKEIEEQLEAFQQSLYEVKSQYQATRNSAVLSPVPGQNNERQQRNNQALQMEMVIAYGTHIMHVLHILLTGKWDPIALLDDNDLWISSQSFVNATNHAVRAAKALADIIDYDPDLSFVPYFFGIYLLQGSFLLLLFADKLQDDITSDVVRACETIVRAHEACVSTLDNQYQRNFRRVMRSSLQQLRGRGHENATEQQNWRREILKLYRWTGDGTGLAL